MRNKREKGYWLKKKEPYNSGKIARSRAAALRICEEVSHVTVEKEDEKYVVRFSVAKWYWESIEKAGLSL